MHMSDGVFFEVVFFALILFSILLPIGLYIFMLKKRAISRNTVLVFGVLLIFIAGIDIFLLQRLTTAAQHSASTLDDLVFGPQIAVALYLLPGLFAGIGVNMISHILVSHLIKAEKRFDSGDR